LRKVAGKSGLKLWVVAGDASGAAPKSAPRPDESVGLFLRFQRERMGLSPEEAARRVRIRLAYVHAIEDDRFDLLPGRAYATGFVRAYAEFLGADVEATCAAAFSEIGRLPTPELRARRPETERGSRAAPIAAAAVCLALAGYVYWYFDNTRARFETAADTLARVDAPNFIENGETSLAASSQPYRPFPDAAAPNARPVPDTLLAGQPAPESEPAPAAVPDATSVAAADTAPVETTPVPPVRAELDRPRTPAAPLPAPAALAASLPAPRLEAPRPTPTWSIPTPGSAMASTPHGAPPMRAVVTPGGEPPPPAAGQVTLRAVADTWLQIKSVKTGAVLFSRVLRVGETYEAPDRRGLKMTVGNAGGLEILVDGQPAPTLGGHGEVVRDVMLEGPLLLAREQ